MTHKAQQQKGRDEIKILKSFKEKAKVKFIINYLELFLEH